MKRIIFTAISVSKTNHTTETLLLRRERKTKELIFWREKQNGKLCSAVCKKSFAGKVRRKMKLDE
jgi:hypothetical protein